MSDLFGLYKTDIELNEEILNTINGLNIFYDFISIDEEQLLLSSIESQNWIQDLKRKVQHYGYRYNYKTRRIDQSLKIGDLPKWIDNVISKIRAIDSQIDPIDQVIINNYEPGQGIAAHIDCEPCFGNYIISLSLLSDIIMEFTEQDSGRSINVLLPRRSLVVIKDEARYKFLHGIRPRKKDKFNHATKIRFRRVSLTFRSVIL